MSARGGGAAAGAGRAADAAGAAGALARCAHAARCFVCPTCDKQVCSAHMDGIKVGGGERQHAPPAPLSAPSLASPPAAAATIFIRRSPPPALSRLQPNFDLGVEQAVVRIWMKSPWAAAKECSFCRRLYCYGCEPNTFCSHPSCSKLACPDDKGAMYFCATCWKHFCLSCRPPITAKDGQRVCGIGSKCAKSKK